MAYVKIAKKKLPEFIAALSGRYAVFGPSAEAGPVAFRRIASAEELALDYRNSIVSPKELFLPRTEVVYEFDGKKILDDVLPEEKRVLFAMRPCDCRALVLLDRIFDGEEVKDPFYVTRRANTVIVSLGCNRPAKTCFCTSVGGDPFGEEGSDVLLGDLGDSLLAKALTPKGKDFLAGLAKFFSDQATGDWQKQATEARDKIGPGLKLENIKDRLDELFDDDVWETVSNKCLGCGTCSYLCPICYCFDLTDQKTAAGAKKVRSWDCCMFDLFTRHASGHNPRPVKAMRLRQKVMHKFSYNWERYGLHGCVGCGRCVRSCPVNLDIRQLLAEMMMTTPKTLAER